MHVFSGHVAQVHSTPLLFMLCLMGLLDVTLSRVTQSGDPSPGMRIPGSHRGIRQSAVVAWDPYSADFLNA
eukprot:CAMPEP_0181201982 /NCGR_PEP_ID=MMETSP1096-20121128/18594_1 /TAXON_ID=156174 ORGANISM="Chrysochromulina ericina, Strain CCMP281" /NCGR_SAMPLE_ID=MMETSP1096 /ASSEMBLY_ACC=CAM_ASM_000453 /LENGTH=70 /DNA_ID=CAMNT_0023292455 /DNA_START=559 /DNA_END=771 /DNA_ORIENTATION=-